MNKISEYQKIIEAEIQAIKFPSNPVNLYDPLRYFLSLGGKRIRPILTLLACDLFGINGKKALSAAIAIELFHNFTLIHDDIMDEAPLRRGHASVHKKWNEDVAILSGDVLYTTALEFLIKQHTHHLPSLLSIFNKTAKEVCEGQQMDMDFEKRDEISISDYLEMIRLKTSVLLGSALKMGAVIADQEKNSELLFNFGENMGMAFQLHDDILDLYADTNKFGKQLGGDVLENKKTYLLLKAFEIADTDTKDNLKKILKTERGAIKITKIKSIFDQLDIPKMATALKLEYYSKAIQNLDAIDLPSEQKTDLIEFAADIMKRTY